jgi:AraC-like DNA-binding protein
VWGADGVDHRPVSERERAEVLRKLGPLVEVPPPGPVARVQHTRLPSDLGLWRGYVERLWMRAGSGIGIHRLPDLYAGLWLNIERQRGDGSIARCHLLAFGSRSRLAYVPICEGEGALGVLLPLAMAPGLLGVPAEALTNHMVPLEELWGHPARLLEERLAGCRDDIDRMVILNRLLRRRLLHARGHDEPRIYAAVRAIEACAGSMTIDALADGMGFSRRSLERLFAHTFGISPKRYARMARLEQAIHRLIGHQADELDWTALALDVGCYDQSHLVHEFQDFTGMPPGAFAAIPEIGFTLNYGAVLLPRGLQSAKGCSVVARGRNAVPA